ncbi:MAG: transcriptional regulator [Candidatus Methanomethylophilaceae archaeon]
MKIPCEVVVWYLLPTIRRELAKKLVADFGYTQSKVAKTFGLTDAAVSQYLKNKRGDNLVVTGDPNYFIVDDQISLSARSIAESGTDFAAEVCNICVAFKKSGILAKIYEVEFGEALPACICGSRVIQP